MRPCVLGAWVALTLCAQTPRDLFQAHCAGCHGPAGEGSRGPALKVAALQRTNDLEGLINLLRRGIPGTEMSAIAPQAINDSRLRALAGYVLGLRTTAATPASARLARGREFFRTKGKCLDCHRVNGEGSPYGPDLSEIGRQREPKWLHRALLEPEAAIFDSFAAYRWTIQIPDNYLLVDVTTKAGEHVTGSRINEDPFSIQIRDKDGRIRSFLKGEVIELHKQWGKSSMPSYKDIFSRDELDAIVAYLAGLRGIQ